MLCSTQDYISAPGRQGLMLHVDTHHLTLWLVHAKLQAATSFDGSCSDRHVKHLMGDLVTRLNKIQALRHRHVSQAFQAALGFPATFGDLDAGQHIQPLRNA